jgi:4-hydroxybenzoate polyprenyltransferase
MLSRSSGSTAAPLWWLHLRHSGAPIGGVAAAFVAGTSVLAGVPIDGGLLALAFCGTALVYLVDRAATWSPEDAVNRPSQSRWRTEARGWIGAEAAALVVAGTVALTAVRPATVVAGAALGGVGVLHVAPMLPGRQRLKAWSLFKPLTIGVVWAAGGVVLPMIEAGASAVSFDAAHLAAYRVLFVAPNVLLADWIDREGDAAAGLTTVGTTLSLRTLQVASTVALSLAVGVALWAGLGSTGPWFWIVDAIGPALLLGAAWRLRADAPPSRTLLLDLIVAWPGVTAFVATMSGHG